MPEVNINTAMVPADYEPLADPSLIRAKNGLIQVVEAKAKENLAQWEGLTQTQQQAVFLGECLRQINGVDFVALNLRAHYLRKIFLSNAVTNHPGVENGNMKQFLKEVGMSPVDVSRIADLWNVVFPWVEGNLGVSAADFFMNIGSVIWDILPVFKALATGAENVRGTVKETLDRLLGEVVATVAQTGEELTPEQLRNRALENLVERATTLPVRELRHHLRPGNEDGIFGTYLKKGGQGVFLARMTDDQLKRFLGATRDWVTPQTLDLDDVQDITARRHRIRTVPEVVALKELEDE
jgi:hypothetical protein